MACLHTMETSCVGHVAGSNLVGDKSCQPKSLERLYVFFHSQIQMARTSSNKFWHIFFARENRRCRHIRTPKQRDVSIQEPAVWELLRNLRCAERSRKNSFVLALCVSNLTSPSPLQPTPCVIRNLYFGMLPTRHSLRID